MSDTPSKKALILSAIFEDIRAGKYFGPVALDKAYEAGRDAASADLSAALEAVSDYDAYFDYDNRTLLGVLRNKHARIIALAKGRGG